MSTITRVLIGGDWKTVMPGSFKVIASAPLGLWDDEQAVTFDLENTPETIVAPVSALQAITIHRERRPR